MASHPRLIYLAAAVGVLLVLIVGLEIRIRRDASVSTQHYARTLAPLLWEVDTETAQEYLAIILTTHPYGCISVVHDEGASFARASSDARENSIERLLRMARLIRDEPITVPITYQGLLIGRVEATWINRNIYVYLGSFAMLVVGYVAFTSVTNFRRARREREQAERALSESKVRLQTVVSGAPVILFALDRDGRFTLCEGKGLDKLKLEQGELVGHSIAELGVQSPARETDFLRTLRGERFTTVHTAGDVVFESRYSPLHDGDSRIVGVIGVSTDITDLRRALTELEIRDRRIRHELALARTIHRALIPAEAPTLPGFEFGLLFIPSGDIGGDIVDFALRPGGGSLGVVVADVTGHGVPAALLAAMFKALIDDVLRREPGGPAAGRMAELNLRVSEEFPTGNFASTFYAELDAATRRMTYVSAAQEPALRFRAGRPLEILQTGGPVLGLLTPESGLPVDYTATTVALQPGDTVFLYTDGLVEIENRSGRMLTRDELIGWLHEDIGLAPQALVERLHARAVAYAGSTEMADDIAALAIRVLPDHRASNTPD